MKRWEEHIAAGTGRWTAGHTLQRLVQLTRWARQNKVWTSTMNQSSSKFCILPANKQSCLCGQPERGSFIHSRFSNLNEGVFWSPNHPMLKTRWWFRWPQRGLLGRKAGENVGGCQEVYARNISTTQEKGSYDLLCILMYPFYTWVCLRIIAIVGKCHVQYTVDAPLPSAPTART